MVATAIESHKPNAATIIAAGGWLKSLISSMAFILGAPLSVPAGNVSASSSNGLVPGLTWPVTSLTRCMTC